MFRFLRFFWPKAQEIAKHEDPTTELEKELGVEFLRQHFYDEFLDMDITVEIVCTCGLPVVRAGEDSFYCLHCDRHCIHGLPQCPQCRFGMADRPED